MQRQKGLVGEDTQARCGGRIDRVPHSIVLDSEGNVWFTEMGLFFRKQYTNKVGRLTP